MNRILVVNNLQTLLNKCKRRTECEKKISAIMSENQGKEFENLIQCFFITFVASFLIIWITLNIWGYSSYHSDSSFYGSIAFIFSVIITIFNYKKVYGKLCKKEVEKEKERLILKNAKELKLLQKEYLEINHYIEYNNLLGEKYKNEFALEYVVRLFKDMRADSIKEALNLFEDYLFKEKQLEYLENITRDIKKNTNQIKAMRIENYLRN